MKSLVSFPRYEGYKDSGEPWIGDVPEHWKTVRLGALLSSVSIKNRPELPLLSITREQGVILRDRENDENHNYIPDDLSNYKLLKKGQFGMNKMKAWQGSYGISNYTGIVSPAYFIFNFTKAVNPDFFNWAIRSRLYVSFFGSASDGVRIGQWDLSQDRMKVIPFLMPKVSEQKNIATFLNQKTTQIDQAIDIKKKQIELLKERQQVVIQQAVTKGLDPAVRMKDSGVEWIGEVPEHWDLKALKYIAHMQSGETIKPEDFKETGYPVYGGNGFRGYTNKYTNLGDHILIGRQGALCGNVNYATGKFFASEHAIVVYPYENDNHFWLGEAIRLADFNRLSQSAAQPGIAVSIIKNEFFPYPPLNEQNEISNYIIKTKKTFDIIENIYYEQIKKLQEYKASLINSAVTGKIKITPDMIAAEE